MILFPAIDLKDGQCVRLLKGEMDTATVFNDAPGVQARLFQDAGCGWIHVVDLDGAFAGESRNGDAVDSILAAVDVPVQLGGGIRDMAAIDAWLEKGVARVILGTVALRDPELVKAASLRHPGRIVVGIDARDGMVAVQGLVRNSTLSAIDVARRLKAMALPRLFSLILTGTGRLAVLIWRQQPLWRALSTPVIASGGVAS